MLAKIIALIGAFKAKDWILVFKLVMELINDIQSGKATDAELTEVQNALQIVEAVRATR